MRVGLRTIGGVQGVTPAARNVAGFGAVAQANTSNGVLPSAQCRTSTPRATATLRNTDHGDPQTPAATRRRHRTRSDGGGETPDRLVERQRNRAFRNRTG